MNDKNESAVTGSVVACVWPWRQRLQANAEKVRVFPVSSVLVQTLVAGAVASFLLKKHYTVAAIVVALIAVAMALLAVAWPAGYHGIQRGLQVFGRGVGLVVTYLLLVPCFFLIFGLVHLLLLVFGADPLGRKYDRARDSYWEDHAPPSDPAKSMEVPY